MKKLGLSVAMFAFATVSVFAQEKIKSKGDKMRQGRDHHSKNKAMEQLNLTEDQKTQLKANRADFHQQLKALESNENQTVKQLRDQKAALAKSQKAKMESILTTDQKAKFSEMKEKGRQKHQEHSAMHFDKMKQELNLTENQVTSLKKSQETTKNKMKALRENDQMDRVAKREQMKAIHNEMKQNFERVLNKEQKEKLESRKGEMKHIMMNRKHRVMDRSEVK
ncbi:MAG: hypothetical protein V4722_20840 [Bacteroidota bacterium]